MPRVGRYIHDVGQQPCSQCFGTALARIMFVKFLSANIAYNTDNQTVTDVFERR